jgi:hypothetical protein
MSSEQKKSTRPRGNNDDKTRDEREERKRPSDTKVERNETNRSETTGDRKKLGKRH